MKYILIYFVLMNLVTFFIFGLDKRKAKKHAYRIPEKTLFLLAVAGGSIGAETGMLYFRHKTKHARFLIGIPLIIVLQILVLFALERIVKSYI